MLTLHHTQKRILDFGFGISNLRKQNCKAKGNFEDHEISNSEIRNSPLPLHTNNLLDLSDNFNQVFLVLHYRFN